ncbi:efflux RND transporter permease subunit [Rhodobacteraceae bacterium RKSG542]|uniref:efflux RND transporter permease subunit n=1 Tax=Pseudovibrio flavus TaxID=2529854 RepID=UPI0012BBA0EB|nr:efflux RND transporter permease subunit [Pseudovibrio flavus]MTI15760.1 efflux RND transporter permease subunit [Pseudovibrio flavus]
MSAFLRFFIDRPFFASVTLCMVCLIGIASLYTITVQDLPAAQLGEISITTSYPGSSADEVELRITNPIETEVKSVEGLASYSSSSFDGESQLLLTLRDGEDFNKVLQDVKEAVDRAKDLPQDLDNKPLVELENSAKFEFFTFGIYGDLGFPELREVARQLEKEIRSISGVGKIERISLPNRAFTIALKPEALAAYGLKASDVRQAVLDRNFSGNGGEVWSGKTETNTLILSEIKNSNELSETVVTVLETGTLVRISDVAVVENGFDVPKDGFSINGQRGIGFTLYKTEKGDILKTIERVKSVVEEKLKESHQNIYAAYSLDLSESVAKRFDILSKNALVGIILVLAVLFIALQRKLAFWVTSSLPFCIFGTISLLMAFGFSLDSISMSAILLVIGIVIDDAIVVAESIDQQFRGGLSAREAAVEGYRQVFKPIIASVLTTLIVFIPILFVGGSLGSAFMVLPLAIIMALVLSIVDATFLLPAHLAKALGKTKSSSERTSYFDHCKVAYVRFMGAVVKLRYFIVSGFFAVSVGVVFVAVSELEIDFFPSTDAQMIELEVQMEEGTSLKRVQEVSEEVAALLEYPSEVDRFHLAEATPTFSGLIVLTEEAATKGRAKSISQDIERKITTIKGVTDVSARPDSGGPPAGEPLAFRVFGADDTNRLLVAKKLRDWLLDQPGASDVRISEETTSSKILLVPKYDRIAKLGISVSDIMTNLEIALKGQAIASSWVGEELVDITLWYSQADRNEQSLPNIDVFTHDGEAIPLRDLVSFERVETPTEILHWNGERSAEVTGKLDKSIGNTNQISTQALSFVQGLEGVQSGIQVEIAGEAEMTNEALLGLAMASGIALIGVWLIISLLFGSLVQPLLALSVIPVATASALLALLLHSMALSFFGAIGILGLCGVVLNNALVMINCCNNVIEKRSVASILEAASTRLRPILLTSLTTITGLLPLAYGLGGKDIFMGPMALCLGYGVLFTVPFILVGLPCLVLIGDDLKAGTSWLGLAED